MRSSSRNLSFLAVVALGGCSQIIGLSDYDVAGGPGANAGQSSTDGGEPNGSAGERSGGGTRNQAGEPGNDAGTGAVGGTMPVAGASSGGEGGAPIVRPPACTTSLCCKNMGGVAVPTELLPDGDFENNPASWGTDPKNIFTEANANTIDAHSGTGFAWLGGEEDKIFVLLSPEFTVPEDTGWLVVSGYYWLKFDSSDATGDSAFIEMYDSAGDFSSPEESLFSWTTSAEDTSGWKAFTKEFPVKGYTSGTYDIAVTGITDQLADDPQVQAASNFFFDDISLKAYRCQL